MNDVANEYALTNPQKNIWLVDRFNQKTSIAIVAGMLYVDGDIVDIDLHQKVINNIIEKNDALRLNISIKDGEPVQMIKDFQKSEFAVEDVNNIGLDKIDEYILNEVSKNIEVLNNKLYDFKIFKYSEKKVGILCRFHHIIGDAWSLGQYISQYSKVYEQMLNNTDELLEYVNQDKPSYLDFIHSENEYMNSEKFKKASEFFDEYLKDIKEPVSLAQNSKKSSNSSKRYAFKVPSKLNKKIEDFCTEYKISEYALFLSVLGIYVNKITRKEDYIIGTPVLNRSNFKEKQMLGMFVSTIPMRFKVNEEMSFLELAKNVGLDSLKLFRHQKYPYSKILENVRKSTNIKSNLYNIVLSYQNARADYANNEKFSSKWYNTDTIQAEIEMHIVGMDGNGSKEICYDYMIDLFEEKEIEYLNRRIINIIESVIENPNISIGMISAMDNKELLAIMDKYNNTYKEYQLDKTVIHLFQKQVLKNPDNVALINGEEKLTYLELSIKINKLASKLQNIKNENIIVCMNNSFDLITAIYAILKSGNSYVPISPTTPQERIYNIMKDCDCKYAISDVILENVKLIDLNEDEEIELINNDYSTADKLAYIIYTSGSTGKPKGVRILHRSLTNYICFAGESYENGKLPTMPLYSSIAFDLTITTVFMPLVFGGTIHIYNSSASDEILNIFKEDKVNTVKLTPAHLSLINETNIKINNIKTLIVGGDALKTADAKKITENGVNVEIFNEYGPTEATVGCMIYKYNQDERYSTVLIGKPASNTNIYILNEDGNPCPLGVTGELCISGIGLAQGYNNLPEKTNSVFVQNENINARIYKTGDIAKINFDLECQYFGRNDKQVKINGNRVELEEIEYCLMEYFNVKNAVADVKDIENTTKLYLYYINDQILDEHVVKNKLKELLPSYMIPSKMMKIDNIPLNGNGKLDRAKLPIPPVSKEANSRTISYKNELEEKICKTWEEILNIKNISPLDNIFDYGVDSLNIIRCQVKLSSIIEKIDIQSFYEYPIIREFSFSFQNLDEIKNSNNSNESTYLKEFENIRFEKKVLKSQKNKFILVGATGFLGISILKELVENNNIEKIYCIVRGKEAPERLKSRFRYYFNNNYEDLYDLKVEVINGEIEKPKFGIDDAKYNEMVKSVYGIINAAAIVKHNGNILDFNMINVVVVKNLIDMCLKNDLVLEHVSTMSVSGAKSDEQFDETKLYINQDYKINPYIESKFNAEVYVYTNIKTNSLKANVYRVGNLTWRHDNGKYQHNFVDNGFYMRLKNIFDLKAYPESFKYMDLEMSPVDMVAKNMVTLILGRSIVNNIYHLYNNNLVKFGYVLDCMKKINNDIKELPDQEFMEILKSYDSRENLLLNDILNSIDTLAVKTSNTITNNILSYYSKKWPEINEDYMMKLLKYLNMSEVKTNDK